MGPGREEDSGAAGLLEWLVRNVDPPQDPRTVGEGETRIWRERLLRRNEAAFREALRLLHEGATRGWAVLEGPSQPDVYLETPEALIVIEGKRTEPGPTTHTTWTDGRHQMIRHMDAIWDHRGSRAVYGFFLVEGNVRGDVTKLPQDWDAACRATVAPATLVRSLPHRSAEEREAIAAAFTGAATWQAACRALDVPWECLPSRVPRK